MAKPEKKQEIKNASLEELQSKLREYRKEIASNKIEHSLRKVKDHQQFKKTRKKIAQILTEINQRKEEKHGS